MKEKIISIPEVSVPSANAVTGVVDGIAEIDSKASEPVSEISSGELWEFNLWKAALKV